MEEGGGGSVKLLLEDSAEKDSSDRLSFGSADRCTDRSSSGRRSPICLAKRIASHCNVCRVDI